MADAKIIASYGLDSGSATNGGASGGGGKYGFGVADRATLFAGFGSPILPGVDYGTRHIVVRASRPAALYAFLYEPPVSGEFIFDVEVSRDGGITWTSILAAAVVIPPGFQGPTIATSFAADAGLAPGNLLRLQIIASGEGPGFSNGFFCTLRLDGASIPGWERATFAMGFTGNVPVGVDLGGYYIVTRATRPGILYCNARNPPTGGAAVFDVQLFRDEVWTSIFSEPLLVGDGVTAVISTTSFADVTFVPGEMLRPLLLSGPVVTGMGYNLALELEVI